MKMAVYVTICRKYLEIKCVHPVKKKIKWVTLTQFATFSLLIKYTVSYTTSSTATRSFIFQPHIYCMKQKLW